MEKIDVVVDSMSRQGTHNIAITLIQTNGKPLPQWEAGAHIDVFLPNKICRQYSLTGNPQQTQFYTLCVKKEPQSRGGSRYIHQQLRVGDTLQISVPRNVFKLQDAERYTLLGAGIGITPILAMAETLEQQRKAFTLFYYVQTKQDVALLHYLSKQFIYGTCEILCDDEGHSIIAQLPDAFNVPHQQHHVYMCGPAGFMNYCQEQLTRLGWHESCIYKEAFAPIVVASDVSIDCFQVKLKSTGQVFDVPQDKTIATVLIENDIAVPLSCEMGMCGACLTEVCSGEVDHQDTVQSEQEKQAMPQHIALCCSRAKSSLIEINL